VIADLRLAGRSAFPLLEAAARREPAPAVVAMSGQASAEESFRLGRLGVRAYLAKPFASDALLAAVDRAEREPLDPAPETGPGRADACLADEQAAGPRAERSGTERDGGAARLGRIARRMAQRVLARRRAPGAGHERSGDEER
jgi:DNA-binding response OmpR family regulator